MKKKWGQIRLTECFEGRPFSSVQTRSWASATLMDSGIMAVRRGQETMHVKGIIIVSDTVGTGYSHGESHAEVDQTESRGEAAPSC